MTNAELLVEIDNALQKILVTGQSYRIGSRQVTRADLVELKEWRKQVAAEASQGDAANIDGAYVAYFNGR